jgi:hypothetical protein
VVVSRQDTGEVTEGGRVVGGTVTGGRVTTGKVVSGSRVERVESDGAVADPDRLPDFGRCDGEGSFEGRAPACRFGVPAVAAGTRVLATVVVVARDPAGRGWEATRAKEAADRPVRARTAVDRAATRRTEGRRSRLVAAEGPAIEPTERIVSGDASMAGAPLEVQAGANTRRLRSCRETTARCRRERTSHAKFDHVKRAACSVAEARSSGVVRRAAATASTNASTVSFSITVA